MRERADNSAGGIPMWDHDARTGKYTIFSAHSHGAIVLTGTADFDGCQRIVNAIRAAERLACKGVRADITERVSKAVDDTLEQVMRKYG